MYLLQRGVHYKVSARGFFESLIRISSFPAKIVNYSEVSALQNACDKEIQLHFQDVITLPFSTSLCCLCT